MSTQCNHFKCRIRYGSNKDLESLSKDGLIIDCNDFIRCRKARCHLEEGYLSLEQIQNAENMFIKKNVKLQKYIVTILMTKTVLRGIDKE